MHYYKRHLGDYAKDTGHLSALEHGVYTLLLDWYYANERPIPPDKATRIARGNPEETQTVLSEFFRLSDDGWVHHYADRVIAEYNVKAERNREIGRLGGRPKTQTVSKPNPEETLATSHKPLTTKEPKQKIGSPNGSRLPDDWSLPPEWRAWAVREREWLDVDQEAAKFADYWRSQPGAKARKTDWLATWRNWIRNAGGKRRGAAPAQPSRTLQAVIALGGRNAVDERGNRAGLPAASVPWPGATARLGHDGRNGVGMVNGSHAEPRVGRDAGCSEDSRIFPYDDGDP